MKWDAARHAVRTVPSGSTWLVVCTPANMRLSHTRTSWPTPANWDRIKSGPKCPIVFCSSANPTHGPVWGAESWPCHGPVWSDLPVCSRHKETIPRISGIGTFKCLLATRHLATPFIWSLKSKIRSRMQIVRLTGMGTSEMYSGP